MVNYFGVCPGHRPGHVPPPAATLSTPAQLRWRYVMGVFVAANKWAPKALLLDVLDWLQPETALWIAVGLIAVAVACVALRAARKRAMLRSRVRYAALPTLSFDPSAEEILRSAHALSRSRPVTSVLKPRSCQSIRIRLLTTSEGFTYQLEGPRFAESALRQSVMNQVELHRLDTDVSHNRVQQNATEENAS